MSATDTDGTTLSDDAVKMEQLIRSTYDQIELLLRKRLENMDWTLERDEEYARLITTRAKEGADEVSMRAYLCESMSRDEKDTELVQLVHWLFHEAPAEVQPKSFIKDATVRTCYVAKLEKPLRNELECLEVEPWAMVMGLARELASLIMRRLEQGTDYAGLRRYLDEISERPIRESDDLAEIAPWLFDSAQDEALYATLADALPFGDAEEGEWPPLRGLIGVVRSSHDTDSYQHLVPHRVHCASDASSIVSDGSSESEEGDLLIADEEF